MQRQSAALEIIRREREVSTRPSRVKAAPPLASRLSSLTWSSGSSARWMGARVASAAARAPAFDLRFIPSPRGHGRSRARRGHQLGRPRAALSGYRRAQASTMTLGRIDQVQPNLLHLHLLLPLLREHPLHLLHQSHQPLLLRLLPLLRQPLLPLLLPLLLLQPLVLLLNLSRVLLPPVDH